MIKRFGLVQSTPHIMLALVAGGVVVAMPWAWWVRLLVGLAVLAIAVVSFDNRLLSTWVALAVSLRRPRSLPARSQAARDAIAAPGEDVAVRWDGQDLVGLIALHPKPFAASIVTSGVTDHADVVSTELVNALLARLDVPACADVVSAGWRVGGGWAPLSVRALYEQMIGTDACAAYRRTWILVRVRPAEALHAARWRGEGLVGVSKAVVAAATRLAEELSKHAVDARPADSFAEFDKLTDLGEVTGESWSQLRGQGTYTTVFSAPGGPDQWWSVRADRTVTRVRLSPGAAPRSTVALLTVGKMKLDPVGWVRLRGGQLAGLTGHTPVSDRHWALPIGSSGMLVGIDPVDAKSHVYLPMDGADSVLHIADSNVVVQVALRSVACGAGICLPADPQWGRIAAKLGASTGPQAHLRWPSGARTWLVSRRSSHVVRFADQEILVEPGHTRIPVKWIFPREESGLVTLP